VFDFIVVRQQALNESTAVATESFTGPSIVETAQLGFAMESTLGSDDVVHAMPQQSRERISTMHLLGTSSSAEIRLKRSPVEGPLDVR